MPLMRCMKRSLAVLLLAVNGSAVAVTADIIDIQGRSHSIQEYGQGRWLIVMIWASDCHVCNSEVGGYVELFKQHGGRKLQVLGISIDGESRELDAEAFVERHSVSFPNLIVEPETIHPFYFQQAGAMFRGTPTFLVYDPGGQLKAAQAGGVPSRIVLDFIERNGQ